MEYKLKSHPEHLLVEHLRSVTAIQLELLCSYGIQDSEILELAKIVGMCHDFAKSTKYFQDRLIDKKKNKLANHGLASAIFAYWILSERFYNKINALVAYLTINRHHGDINNTSEEIVIDDEKIVCVRESLNSLDLDTIQELNNIYIDFGIDINNFLIWVKGDVKKEIKRSGIKRAKNIDIYFKVNLIYGLLLTADKMHLIGHNDYRLKYIVENKVRSECVDNYKNKLVGKSLSKDNNIINNKLFQIRQSLYSEMVSEIYSTYSKSIFSLNVPTGSGKTLLAYKAALLLNNKSNKLGQIIYCLPFTSVIDQNYNVLKDIITGSEIKVTDDILIKHHSLTDIDYNIDNDVAVRDIDSRFCTENWQSGIVCTTFIQLFDTMFKSSKNSIGNRYHRLINSVVILDELQCIEPKYFSIIEELFRFMVKNYNMKIIIVSATMPLLFEDTEKTELIPDKEKYFLEMDRIYIENHSDNIIEVERFSGVLNGEIMSNPDKSFLVVLNTIKSSKKVYRDVCENCKERKVIYLSTEIYPKLRMEIINKIRESNDKYIVVTTQLIEAGVDIDMDIVYRDFGPLDSINQVCGRANRNALKGKGVVKIYRITDGRCDYCTYVYPKLLLKITSEIFEGKGIIAERELYSMSNTYFTEVRARMSGEENGVHSKLSNYVYNMAFRDLRETFQLIDKDNFGRDDIIVNIDKRCENLLSRLDTGGISKMECKKIFRELKKYTISTKIKDDKNGDLCCSIRTKFELKVITAKQYNSYDIEKLEPFDTNREIGINRESTICF